MKLKHSILALVAILTSFSFSSYAQEYVALVGETKYESFVEAMNAAAEAGETVTLLNNVEITESYYVTLGKTLTLDLNGKTISATDNTSKNYSVIDNRGNLTITDSSEEQTGKITLTATINSGWNRYSAVIANNPGGKLTVNGGTLEHCGGTDMAYGIDNLTNGKGTYAETIINGGTIRSTYRGIRQFLNGVEAQNILTINGGTIEGSNKSIWMQDPSNKANTGTLTVTEDARLIGDVYLFVTAGSTEWPVEVSIAEDALQGESTILTGNVPEGNSLVSDGEGNWIVLDETTVPAENVAWVNGTAYTTLQEAIDAATEGATVTLLRDLEVTSDLNNAAKGLYNIKENQRINIDLNGKTINVTDQSEGNFIIFYNYGDLTIGNGEVYLTADNNRAWNAQSTIILNRGGNLVVESGTYIHNGGTDMAITMDNSGNSFGDAYMTVNGGTLESTYTGIRNRMANTTLNGNPGNGVAILTINGGTIQGDKRGIWGQITNAYSGQLGSLTVTGGTIEGDVNSIRMDTDGHDNTTVSISGDNTTINGSLAGDVEDFNITGGSYDTEIPEGFLAEGYKSEPVEVEEGVYIYVPQAREITLDEIDTEISIKDEDDNVTYKKITLKRTINVTSETSKSNWNTFVVPFDMAIPEGWEVKTLDNSKMTDEGITLTFADAATIEAGVPYMVRTNAKVETIEVTDVTLSTELRHTTIGDVTFEGVYTSGDIPTGSYFISGNKFYRSVNTENPDKIKGYRAYIRLNGNQASNARSLSYRFAGQGETEEGTTAIEATTEEATVKAIYTLDGTRISEMQQGVNILQMSDGSVVKVIIK